MKKFVLAGIVLVLLGISTYAFAENTKKTVPIGSERQLFLDDQWLIASMQNVEILVHQPVRKELSDIRNRPWEGAGSKFHTVLYDPIQKVYHMYYVGTPGENITPWHTKNMYVCYLQSKDGIHWPYRPLHLMKWGGSTENNIIVAHAMNFNPFLDSNPKCLPQERFKAIANGFDAKGMVLWTSADGIHWEAKNNGRPVYNPKSLNAFDSQNVAFWSVKEKKYVAYYRVRDPRGFRSVERAVSDDFINWTQEKIIQVPENEVPRTGHGEFYTNQIQPYYRAPQIYIGFPARYNDNGKTESFKLLPEQEERAIRMKVNPRFGTVTPDSVFFSSRDGYNFRLSNDVFLSPGLKTKYNWGYGDNYIGHGIVETSSLEEDEGRELSFYATESSFTGYDLRCRRYVLRIDGFASLHAKTKPGTVVTQPLTFTGKELSLNIATSGYGSAFVEICRVDGQPIPGFTKNDCDMIYGDTLDRRVSWKGSKDVSSLSGQPVVLKFYLCEADIYSLKFE
ncbi:MAG: hypothetical protein Q4G59_06860 [Planctomycetia bacterium]|nr:hypothetical protein [Planctomycetia bacterium]